MHLRLDTKHNGLSFGTISDFQLLRTLEGALKEEREAHGAGHWLSTHAGERLVLECIAGKPGKHWKTTILTRDEKHPILLPLVAGLEAWGRGCPGFTGVAVETAEVEPLALVRLLPLQTLDAPLLAQRMGTLARLVVGHLHRWVSVQSPSLGFRPYQAPTQGQIRSTAPASTRSLPSVGRLFDAATSNPPAARKPPYEAEAEAPAPRT